MATKRELEERLAEMESALEQVSNLSGRVLGLEVTENDEEEMEEEDDQDE